jgi:caffeoyl-CoA O-methyltransferase
MEFPDPLINAYAEAHTSTEPDVLKALTNYTQANCELPQMLSGHLQGRLLALLSRLIQPKSILEIGTYTGYSAICLAEGLQTGGLLHTIDVDESLRPVVEEYVAQAGFNDRIKTYFGNAVDVIPTLDGPFDMVFIDADKQNYSRYFDLVFAKVRTGGLILADNVLWSGRVLDDKQDNRTKALDAFNKKMAADKRISHVLLPVRDGLHIVQKIV